jgi:hypothetical protein
MVERLTITANAQREVSVTIVDLARPPDRARRRMDDQMQLPSLGKLVPRTAERERRARNFGEPEHDAVKVFRALHVGHADSDVMQTLYFDH